MKLIDKDKVEKILGKLWKEDDGHYSEHRICYNKALQEVQCELDNLEAKEVKDLALTIEDMRELYIIFAEVDVDIEIGKIDIKTETLGYYQEVLNRFKDLKK